MTPINEIPAVCNYGTSAVYSDYPSPEQMRAGVVPLDSLPAAWWNKMWYASNCAINEARDMVGQLITELNSVLAQADICPQAACTDQLYQSINSIRQRLATASVPGAVVSSADASKVAVAADGTMTVNCLGNAASLSTSASTVVGAINELKSTYDTCFGNVSTALSGKAPTSHASSATTYGVGSADNYGHLKISDTYTSVLAACSGVAASQKALACVYAVACAAAAGNVSLGNTAGCALGTAAAGTAITAARSDHVHPVPAITSLSGTLDIDHGGTGATTAANARTCLGLGSAATCAATAFRPSTWTPTCVAALCYTGVGNGVVTAYQTCAAYCGSAAAEWASYLIFNHGCGETYYNQMIRMPFGGVPQYQRKSNGANSGWKTFITSENIASQSVSSATSATNATKACCASCNGSGTAFGNAATRDVFTRSDVGDIGWGTAANRTKVVDVGAVAYWNGAYQGTNSNLRYYCGGAFGTAAACAASCFRASNWTPSCVTCASSLYSRPASSQQTGIYNLYFYSGCNVAVGHAPSYYTSCICGANGYYYGNICGNVCGTATSANRAICAGSFYNDNCVYLCVYGVCTCSCSSCGLGRGFLCNNNSSPVMFMMPVPTYMCREWFEICGYGCVCTYDRIEGPRPFSLVQIEAKGNLPIKWLATNSNLGPSCTKIPYRLLGYTNQ